MRSGRACFARVAVRAVERDADIVGIAEAELNQTEIAFVRQMRRHALHHHRISQALRRMHRCVPTADRLGTDQGVVSPLRPNC